MQKVCSVWTAGDFNAKKCIGYNFGQGIIKQGYKIDQHYPGLIAPMNPPFCHLVVANGFRNPVCDAARFLKEKGDVNTIVYDLGYLDRSDAKNKNGYYQLGLNRIGWTPEFKCPSDRFDNLGYKIIEVGDNGNNCVLVCAQKFNDGQHGMSAPQMKKLMLETCHKYAKLGYEVIFRSHPKSPFKLDNYETPKGSLKECFDRCRFMVTYNSTAGVEALLNGTPVIAIDEGAHYKCVSSELIESEGLTFLTIPTIEGLEEYFYRLAYSQWKLNEVNDGYPFKFILAVMKGKNPFDLDIDYTALQPNNSIPQSEVSDAGKIETELLPKCIGETSLTIEGLAWMEARIKVKTVTGLWPKNKVEMGEIVEKYNGKA